MKIEDLVQYHVTAGSCAFLLMDALLYTEPPERGRNQLSHNETAMGQSLNLLA